MSGKEFKRITHQRREALARNNKQGQSKHEQKKQARKDAATAGEKHKQVKGIFSKGTLKDYEKHSNHFIKWIDQKGYSVKCLSDCREYVKEYYQEQIDKGLSASTIRMRVFALCSVYNCDYKDFGIDKLPSRNRRNIFKNRTPPTEEEMDDDKFDLISKFITATGVRRCSFNKLRRTDIKEENGDTYVYVQGKGGKKDWCIVLPQYADFVKWVFDESPGYMDHGQERIFPKKYIPNKMNAHYFRGCYAKELYKLFEKRGYANGKKYKCRKELLGTEYDKGILMQVSYNLLHSRCDVVVSHYLY